MKQRSLLMRIAFLALLVLSLGGPVLSNIDPWDTFPDSGDTALFILGALALCLGAAFIARWSKPRSPSARRYPCCTDDSSSELCFQSERAAAAFSVPILTPLRI
jgi:hypothetical protein